MTCHHYRSDWNTVTVSLSLSLVFPINGSSIQCCHAIQQLARPNDVITKNAGQPSYLYPLILLLRTQLTQHYWLCCEACTTSMSEIQIMVLVSEGKLSALLRTCMTQSHRLYLCLWSEQVNEFTHNEPERHINMFSSSISFRKPNIEYKSFSLHKRHPSVHIASKCSLWPHLIVNTLLWVS